MEFMKQNVMWNFQKGNDKDLLVWWESTGYHTRCEWALTSGPCLCSHNACTWAISIPRKWDSHSLPWYAVRWNGNSRDVLIPALPSVFSMKVIILGWLVLEWRNYSLLLGPFSRLLEKWILRLFLVYVEEITCRFTHWMMSPLTK